MLRWKRRDEGFEWQQYVRTTIKLRREARREKAQRLGQQAADGARAVGAAAAEGAKAAGAAAGAAAASGARRAGTALQAFAHHAGDVAVAGLGLAGLALGQAARWLGGRLTPLADVLGRPGVAGPLVFAGAIATAAGVGRALLAGGGLDVEAKTALGIGLTCFALGLGPSMWLGHSRWARPLAAPFAVLAKAGPRARLAAVGVGIAAVSAGALLYLRPAGMTLPVLGNLPALPSLTTTIVEGQAAVVAADLIRIGDSTVRLTGIEAPDPDQRCGRSGSRTWRCGETAREATQRLVRGRMVRCETGRPDAQGVATGSCHAGDADVAALLVRGGHVFAEAGIAPRYRGAEAEAREAKAGIWAAPDPERPGAWRARMWDQAKRRAPDGCPIKGQVSRGDRVYLLPWSERYDRVKLNTKRGERWFCSEDEAVGAGWRSAGRG
jgi:endonuclease YncB( thermonuclease family)